MGGGHCVAWHSHSSGDERHLGVSMSRHARQTRRLSAAVLVAASLVLVASATAAALGIHQSGKPEVKAADATSADSSSLELNSEVTPLVDASGLPTPERVSGADRYSAAIAISQRAFPSGADVVYVATGETFPDALSASPAALHEGGPLLLSPSNVVMPAILAEISRLAPSKVVVVGGTNSISPTVYSALEPLAQNVLRLGGADRFESSRNVTTYAFASSGSSRAYVATGTNFPDALGTGAAAGVKDAPIVLVNGGDTSVDTATLTLLKNLGVTQIWLTGGPNGLSTGIESTLDAAIPTYRLSGEDRYIGSQVISREAFIENTDYVFLASGDNYPDALAGSSWAAALSAPLYMVPPSCVPDGVISDIRARAATHVVLLGGEASLSPAVQTLTSCGW